MEDGKKKREEREREREKTRKVVPCLSRLRGYSSSMMTATCLVKRKNKTRGQTSEYVPFSLFSDQSIIALWVEGMPSVSTYILG